LYKYKWHAELEKFLELDDRVQIAGFHAKELSGLERHGAHGAQVAQVAQVVEFHEEEQEQEEK